MYFNCTHCNLGVILVRMASQYFKTYPIHIPGLWKNGPIHILDHSKCWPIHILLFDFLYPFFAGCYTNITVNSCNTKRISSLEKSLSEKYVHIPGCQKNGVFHIGIQKNRAIRILFVEKRGPIIYLAALKKGAIRHAHPYYAIYRKLPPPPPPRWIEPYQAAFEVRRSDCVVAHADLRLCCLSRHYSVKQAFS